MIRNVLMSKDYFGMVYEEIGKIIKFRDEKMNNIKIIMSEDYRKIIECFKFNKISLCKDIEKTIGI